MVFKGVGEIAKFTEFEKLRYEDNLKTFRDDRNAVDTAFNQGVATGKIQVAKSLKNNGVSIDIIVTATGLFIQEIKKL